MMTMKGAFAALVLVGPLLAQTPLACSCDLKDPAAAARGSCSLSLEAAKQPPDLFMFFLKDNSPIKPSRWLALPRATTTTGIQRLADLRPQERAMLWREAIARAKSMWRDQWGLATNGIFTRGQCHLHIHIGRLIDGVEWGAFTVVDGPEGIPDPGDSGLWVHEVNGKLHVHREMIAETVLAR